MSEDEATVGGTEGASPSSALRPRRDRRKTPSRDRQARELWEL